MFKINRFKIIIAALFFVSVSGFATAQAVTLKPPIENASGGGAEVTDIIGKIAGVIFGLALMICPIAIIWGGFEIATAAGDQSKITKGKQIIEYSVIGLAIIALSRVLVEVIKSALG